MTELNFLVLTLLFVYSTTLTALLSFAKFNKWLIVFFFPFKPQNSTSIYVCGMQYNYFKNSEALKNMVENKKLKIMSPSAFNSWLEKNNIKFVKNKIKFNSPELKQIKSMLGDKVI